MYSQSTQSKPGSLRWRFGVGTLVAAWIAVLAFGWWTTMSYEFGASGWNESRYADAWPRDSRLALAADRPTLVVFIHPKCPCTTATLNELDRLLASCEDENSKRPAIRLVATVPADAGPSWLDTKLIARGKQITGCDVDVDRAGDEAARFGASTSGTLMLFDAKGSRRYAGGITVSRGHEGQSSGADSLRRQLAQSTAEATVMPVFGCRLCLPNDQPPQAERGQTSSTDVQTSMI